MRYVSADGGGRSRAGACVAMECYVEDLTELWMDEFVIFCGGEEAVVRFTVLEAANYVRAEFVPWPSSSKLQELHY